MKQKFVELSVILTSVSTHHPPLTTPAKHSPPFAAWPQEMGISAPRCLNKIPGYKCLTPKFSTFTKDNMFCCLYLMLVSLEFLHLTSPLALLDSTASSC